MRPVIAVSLCLIAGCAASASKAKTDTTTGKKDDKDPAALEPWKKVLKDTRAVAGYIKTHIKKDQTVYFELPPDRLNTDFGMVLHLSRGVGQLDLIDGLPVTGGLLLRFHRAGHKVFVVVRNPRLTADPGSPMRASVDDNAGHSIIAALPVVSEHETSKAVLVNATALLTSNYPQLELSLQPHYGDKAKNPVSFDGVRSFVANVAGFPRNTEIDVVLTYQAQQPPPRTVAGLSDPRSIPVGVRYSLFALPEQPMQPRFGDDRVGFFTSPVHDFSRERDTSGIVELIHRWRLEKRDPSAPRSEPVQPIVFYIDRTVPEAYRPYVRAGIEEWNVAFEAAGFDRAIVARDAPDDPAWSAEDIRYSTVRWSAAHEMGYAIGPSQVDPRTRWTGFADYPAAMTGESALGVWACLELAVPRRTTGICVLLEPAHRSQPAQRLESYLDGWLAAVEHVLANAGPNVIGNLIVQNLVYPKVLDLKRAHTADDFRTAVLAPRRLGRLVGDPVKAMRSLDSGRS